MKKLLSASVILLLLLSCGGSSDPTFEPPFVEEPGDIPEVTHFLTQSNRSSLFSIQEKSIAHFSGDIAQTITIDAATTYQEMDGFGFAITGGSAKHLSEMSVSARATLLAELFDTNDGQIGMSFIRISLGASDLDETVFSYNDLPNGETDEDQTNFSIDPDQNRLIPILKEIIAINPDIKIMASPWSPPSWMKDNDRPIGGSLQQKYYDSYALYMLKYITAMQQEGINITHLTVQNEPLHDGNNPSMNMSATEQANFIKNSLGPLFEENSIATKIVIYDHNPDRIDYPLEVLDDAGAKSYINGSAFHLYAGNISALSTLQSQHPDRNIYFTEQWFGAPGNFSEDLKWHIREVVIGATRNWSRNVIEWNLSSNTDLTPHTPGGCTQCLGGITIDGDEVTRNAGYYVIAHASKHVAQGSFRISSNYINNMPNVAFMTPANQIVLIVLNNTDAIQEFNVVQDSTSFSVQMNAGAVSTFVWDKL